MTKITGGAAGGLDGVTAKGEGVISDAEPVGEPSEFTPEQLLDAWNEFWKGLDADELRALSGGTANPDLKFRMLTIENSIIPNSYHDQFRGA